MQAVVEDAQATLVDWVMSCRAMNRRLEFAIEERIEEMLYARGVRRILAAWHHTAKNAPVANLFETFGFSVLEADAFGKRYALQLPRSEGLRHFTTIRGR